MERQTFMTETDYDEYLMFVFGLFDFEKSGFIDLAVFKMGMQAFGKPINSMDASKIERDIEKMGVDGVDFETFKRIYIKSFGPLNSSAELEKAFSIISGNEDPFITLDKLKEITSRMQLSFNERELRNIMKEFDHDKDEKITIEDVKRAYK